VTLVSFLFIPQQPNTCLFVLFLRAVSAKR